MTDKERIKEWAENSLSDVESKINGMFGFSEGLYPELIAKRVVLKDLLSLINTLEVREVEDSAAVDIAEEIIINLKRVENDYRIDLTKQMEWLRNIVKKGKEV